MQGVQSSNDNQATSAFSSTLTSALAHSHSLFTPKRVGFTLAGAFVFVGAAAALQSNTSHDSTPASHSQSYTVQSSTDSTTNPESSSNSAADSAQPSNSDATSGSASNSSSTNVTMTVNGQQIDVPANGSVHQTVPTEDGNGQSSVSVDSSTSHSSNSLNVNVSSGSTSSSDNSTSHSHSQTVITQNGGTTVIRSNH